MTGYWYHPEEAAEGYAEPEDLEEFLATGEKPIFVAFGKAESPELARLQIRTLQALRETGTRAVIQADQIPEAERVNTGRLYFIGAVPYPFIFDRVRAVVHHGGNTTNGMGLRAGLPTLVIALALDQYFYGRMDHRIGAGPKPLYIRKKLCSTEEIKDALRDLISGKYDRGAAAAGERIKKEKSVCGVLYAFLHVKGLSLSHESAYHTLENIRISLQRKMEKQHLGTIQKKGGGVIKKMFIDDIESIELLLAHALPEGMRSGKL